MRGGLQAASSLSYLEVVSSMCMHVSVVRRVASEDELTHPMEVKWIVLKPGPCRGADSGIVVFGRAVPAF